MGRPKLPKNEKKGTLFAVRIANDEAKIILDAIKESKKEQPQWMRRALLSAAENPNLIKHMKIKLTVGEIEALEKTPVSSASDGGFQNFLVQLQHRIDSDTGELELDSEDLERIHRYAFNYKNGGWQNRLKTIFARNLGDDLLGK